MYLKYKNSIVELENGKPVLDKRFWFEHILWILKPMAIFLMMMFMYKEIWKMSSGWPNDFNENIVWAVMLLNDNNFNSNFGLFLAFGYLYSVLKKFLNGYSFQRAFIPSNFNLSSILSTILNGGLYIVGITIAYILLTSDQFIYVLAFSATVYFFRFFERMIRFLETLYSFKKYSAEKAKKLYYDDETHEEYFFKSENSNIENSKSRSIKNSFKNFIESMIAPFEHLYTTNEVKELIKADKYEVQTFFQISTRDLIGISPNDKWSTTLFKVYTSPKWN